MPRFVEHVLGVTTYPRIDLLDWLVCPQQSLLEVTAGGVFRDALGTVTEMRAAFSYYPHDVWLYLLAAQWTRIAQFEPFVGRCGYVGDNAGSALVTATLVRDLMRL